MFGSGILKLADFFFPIILFDLDSKSEQIYWSEVEWNLTSKFTF